MKKLILTLLLVFFTLPAFAAGHTHNHADSWLKPVESQFVCRVSNKAFDKPQTAIKVEGKTYYGCCPMCKDMLEKDAAKRSATDPVSDKPVDKASAVIGADPHGNVYYFENQENFHKFASGPMPKMHEHMDGMDMDHMKDMHKEMEHGHLEPDRKLN
ncbi:MAG: hypothetical protein M3O22_02445 [Pseudomonadota bacterium]|nr:hypothetical protein [Pseudomonadota bacterium]